MSQEEQRRTEELVLMSRDEAHLLLDLLLLSCYFLPTVITTCLHLF